MPKNKKIKASYGWLTRMWVCVTFLPRGIQNRPPIHIHQSWSVRNSTEGKQEAGLSGSGGKKGAEVSRSLYVNVAHFAPKWWSPLITVLPLEVLSLTHYKLKLLDKANKTDFTKERRSRDKKGLYFIYIYICSVIVQESGLGGG